MIVGIFGKPRSGKTCYCAYKAHQSAVRKKRCAKLPKWMRGMYRRLFPFYDYFYCTDESVQDTITISYDTLGMWRPPENCCIWLEEAGLGLDCRAHKDLKKETKRLIAMHGHVRGCDIYWSSQTADVDKQLRVRTHYLYMCRAGVGDFSVLQPITYEFGVDNDSGDLKDCYHCDKGLRAFFNIIFRRAIVLWRRPVYKFFDSYIDNFNYILDTPLE